MSRNHLYPMRKDLSDEFERLDAINAQMLAALKKIVEGADYQGLYNAPMSATLREQGRAAIAAAEAVGIDVTEEQGRSEPLRTSEPLPSTGGRTELLEKVAQFCDAMAESAGRHSMAERAGAFREAAHFARNFVRNAAALSPSLGEKE